jgi:hypothetical protein
LLIHEELIRQDEAALLLNIAPQLREALIHLVFIADV